MAEFDGIWAVVKVAGGQYIGQLHVPNNEIQTTNTVMTVREPTDLQDVLKGIDSSGRVFMKPAFEFSMLMKPTPEGIQRSPLTVPINVCMAEVGVWLWPSSISFFGDMKEQDQKSHKSLVEAGLKDIMVSRAAASGLHLGGDMPAGDGGRFDGGGRFG